MDKMFNLDTFEEYKKYLSDRRNSNTKLRDIYEELEDDDSKIDIVIEDKSLTERDFVEIIALCR